MLLKNEEFFAPWAIRNAAPFCDELIIANNQSSDNTRVICKQLAEDFPQVRLLDIDDAMTSHRLIEDYAGKKVWVFGVDADEIYDPIGLRQLRRNILRGELDNYWRLTGHCVHLVSSNFSLQEATGFASPASKSIVKLYNFGALESWHEPRQERLHGQNAVLKTKWHEEPIKDYHELEWSFSSLRCLHLCFASRSRNEEADQRGRRNPFQVRALTGGRGFLQRAASRLGLQKTAVENYKLERYAKGDLITVPIDGFGRPSEAHPDGTLGKLAEEALMKVALAPSSRS